MTPLNPEVLAQVKGETQVVGPRHPQVVSEPHWAGIVTQ